MKRVWDHFQQKEPKVEPVEESWDTIDNKKSNSMGDHIKLEAIDDWIWEKKKVVKKPKNLGDFAARWNDNSNDYSVPILDQEVKPEPIPPKITLEERQRQYDRLGAKYRREMMAVAEEEKSEKFEKFKKLKDPKVENPNEIPKWRPDIEKIKGYLLEDSSDDVDDDCDMKLGTSVLFDQRLDYVPTQPDQEQRILENRIISHFTKNPHPHVMDMQNISELLHIPYSSVFKIFENQRKRRKYSCRAGDPCQRIKSYIAREREEIGDGQNFSDASKRILRFELERHLASQKHFSIGYIHAIMEKTNLPPAYIREQFLKMSNSSAREAPEPKKQHSHAAKIPQSALKELEAKYLQKKYQCANKEWSAEDIDGLATKLRLHPTAVLEWLSKRDHAQYELEQDPNVVEVVARMAAASEVQYSLLMDARQIQKLDEHFAKNSRPGPAERWLIAKGLGLAELQVRAYFEAKRNSLDDKETQEALRRELEGLGKEARDVLEALARKPRGPVLEYIKIAGDLKMPTETLLKLLDFWKTTKTEQQE